MIANINIYIYTYTYLKKVILVTIIYACSVKKSGIKNDMTYF